MIFYITTHDKNIKAANKIKSLFENIDATYYFVYGKGAQEKTEPFLEVNVDEAYENLPLKTYFITEHFLKQTREKVLIKMNDDTFIDPKQILATSYEEDYTGLFVNYTESLINSIYHWYKIKNKEYMIPKPSFNLSYAEGSFYCLSRNAAQAVYQRGYSFFANTPEHYIGEDIKVGMCLSECNFTRKDITKRWLPYYEVSADFSIIHPVHPNLFDKLKLCRTVDKKIELLRKNLFLNDNLKREIFLQKKLKEIHEKNSCNSATRG